MIDKSCGTSTLIRHSHICPENLEIVDSDSSYDHKVDMDMIDAIIIYHDLLFHYVESENVRERDKFLNPNCEPICK